MQFWAAVQRNLPVTDSFLRIEAGPDMRGPAAPAKHRAFPLWTVRAIFAVIILAALGVSAPTRDGVWIGVAVIVGGALLVGIGLLSRRSP
jgi:hypothetical protein